MSEPQPVLGVWEKKCWGLTRIIAHNAKCSVHELQVVDGWQCSKHRHHKRANSFYCDSAILQVVLYGDAGCKSFLLHPGTAFDVVSLVWHRFRVLKSGRIFETYWPDGGDVDVNDIERADEGGKFGHPWPSVGDQIYVSHGPSDRHGGLATVESIEIGMSAGRETPYVRVKGNRETTFNWVDLSDRQDELKKRYGDRVAHGAK